MAGSKVQAVKIETTRVNKYSTIVRACMTASNAAAALQEGEMHEALERIMQMANYHRQDEARKYMAAGPAQG